MDALAPERIDVGREGRHERLSFPGLHLGDLALVQDDPTHELDVEVTLPDRPPGCLPDRSEGFGDQVFEHLAIGEALLELLGLCPKRLVRELLDLRLEGIDEPNVFLQALTLAPFTELSEFFQTYQRRLLGDFRGTGLSIIGSPSQGKRLSISEASLVGGYRSASPRYLSPRTPVGGLPLGFASLLEPPNPRRGATARLRLAT